MVVVTAVGAIIYGVEVPWGTIPAVLVTLAVGAAAFCCLGVRPHRAIPSEDAAAPISNVALLPLYFLSGIFIPESEIPAGVLDFADIFPVRHFFEAFFTAVTRRTRSILASRGTSSRSSPPGALSSRPGTALLPMDAAVVLI